MKKNLTIICIFCIGACSPKEARKTTDSSNQEDQKIEQPRIDEAKKLTSERLVAEDSAKLPDKQTERSFEEKLIREKEQEAVARAKALEDKLASAKAARTKLIGTQLDSLTLPNRKFYNKVVIRNITDLNVSISHDSGLATIRMTDLSPQDQKRFHYDKELAEVVVKAQSEPAMEIVSPPPKPQPNAEAPEKQAMVDAQQAARLRSEISEQENKLAEMKSGLIRLQTEHQNLIKEFDDETSNARRIRNTRYDGIGGNERYGGVSTSKADRQMKIDTAAARVSSGEALIRQIEARIRNLKSQL